MAEESQGTGKALSVRDKIRAKTVGAAKIFKSKIVYYEGIEVEVKEPSVDGWGEILQHAHKDGEISIKEFLIWSVICCSYVPGTDERVFEVEDYDSLNGHPKSGFIGEFSDIANEMMAVDEKVAEKNLGVTAGK